jgi:quercetin dioxygenase-like cupin family protein
MRIQRLVGIGLLGLGAAGVPATASEVQIPPAGVIQHDAKRLAWAGAQPPMPAGARVAVLEGDPKSEHLFTVRLRVPAGARLEPHWHPRDERVTVLKGRVGVGFGDRFDKSRLRYFGAGDYYVNPAESHHFVHFPEASEVQITGQGPWQTHLLPQDR